MTFERQIQILQISWMRRGYDILRYGYYIPFNPQVKYYEIVQINQNPHKSGIWFLY